MPLPTAGNKNIGNRSPYPAVVLVMLLFLIPIHAQSDIPSVMDARIAVIIPEVHIPRPVPDPAGETAIIRTFLEAGFTRMMDQNQVNTLRDSDIVRSMVQGDMAAAQDFALQFGLDYIIVGEAFSELIGTLQGGMVSCRARLEARMIRIDTAQIMATNGFHEAGLDLTELLASKKAFENAGKKMGEYMIQQLMKREGNARTEIKLQVTGIPSFSRLNEFLKILRGMDGVTRVSNREFVGGTANIDIDATISAETLAGMIDDTKASRVEIIEASGNAIKAAMR